MLGGVFLEKELLEAVKEKLAQRNSGQEKAGNLFNVFEITGVEEKEVRVCAFLCELLNPKGKHGQGILFLRSFLEAVLKQPGYSDEELWEAAVRREVFIDQDRRIDLLIQIAEHLFPIEVKLYAADQPGQCEAYYRYCCRQDKNTLLYFLTLDGHRPGVQSRGSLEESQYRCISFEKEIYQWLTSLLEKGGLPEPSYLLADLAQFTEAIGRMTNQQEKETVDYVQTLIVSPEDFRAAARIETAMASIKERKMAEFFAAIEKGLKSYEADLPLVNKDYENQAQLFYQKNKKGAPNLTYRLPKREDSPSQAFAVWIGADSWNLYFAVRNWDDEKRNVLPERSKRKTGAM